MIILFLGELSSRKVILTLPAFQCIKLTGSLLSKIVNNYTSSKASCWFMTFPTQYKTTKVHQPTATIRKVWLCLNFSTSLFLRISCHHAITNYDSQMSAWE